VQGLTVAFFGRLSSSVKFGIIKQLKTKQQKICALAKRRRKDTQNPVNQFKTKQRKNKIKYTGLQSDGERIHKTL